MSKNLFQLIKNLSPNEKGYFKKVSRMHSPEGNSTYIRLFDALDKQSQYDKKKVDAYFEDKKTIKQLPVLSNYLYYLILDTLEEFNSGKTAESRLKRMIANAEQLYIKGLHEQARALINNARAKAEGSENFLLILQIYAFEGKLALLEKNIVNLKKHAEGLNDSKKKVIEKLQNYTEYRQLVSRVFYLSKSSGRHLQSKKDQVELEKIMNHPLLSNRKFARSTSALFNFLLMHSYYHDIKKDRDLPKSIKFNMERLKLLECNRNYVTQSPILYFSVLSNLLLNVGETFDLDLFKFLLEKVKHANTFLKIKPTPEVEKFRNIIYLKYSIFQSFISSDFQQGLNFIKGKESLYYELHKNMSEEEGLVYCLNVCTLFFGTGDFKKALYWINRFLQSGQEMLRMDLWVHASRINIIIQLELKNFEFASLLLQSFIRSLQKHRKEFVFEKHFAGMLKSYIDNAFNNKQNENKLKELKTLLNSCKKSGQVGGADFMFLLPWVKSKIEKQPFLEMYKKSLGEFGKPMKLVVDELHDT
jgi:hypothetical protein